MGNGISIFAFGPDHDVAMLSLVSTLKANGYNVISYNVQHRSVFIMQGVHIPQYKVVFTQRGPVPSRVPGVPPHDLYQANIMYVSDGPDMSNELKLFLAMIFCIIIAITALGVQKFIKTHII